MKGIVVQFRRGRRVIHDRHFLLDFGLTSRQEAKKLAGKEVEWKSPAGKIIKGVISDAHGNNGLVRARFEIGLPGQSVTTEVEVKDSSSVAENKKEAKTETKKEKKESKK